MQSRQYLTLAVLAVGIVWLGGVPAEAQTVSRSGPDRVTVKAEAVRLGDLLDELVAIAPVKILKIDPLDRAVPVSLVVEDVFPLEAIGLVLKASGLDFVMSSSRIVAGRAQKAFEAGGRTEAEFAEQARFLGDDPERRAAWTPDPPDAADTAAQAGKRRGAMDQHLLGSAAGAREVDGGVESGVVLDMSAPTLDTTTMEVGAQPLARASDPVAADEFGRQMGSRPVPFTSQGESAVVTQPGFVPLKLRPEARALRLRLNLADIP
jgi:hypothetical protein